MNEINVKSALTASSNLNGPIKRPNHDSARPFSAIEFPVEDQICQYHLLFVLHDKFCVTESHTRENENKLNVIYGRYTRFDNYVFTSNFIHFVSFNCAHSAIYTTFDYKIFHT